MNTNLPATEDRLVGALLGTALGDALGEPFEGRRRVPARETTALVKATSPLRWTDDTHMAIALAESLLACGGSVEPQRLGDAFAAAYHDQPWRGYAGGPAKVFALAAKGQTYEDAARSLYGGGSYGNGGAMRCAPVAIVAHPDIRHAAHLAAAQARVTHAHPVGVDGAVLLACAIVVAASVAPAAVDPAGTAQPLDLTPIAEHLSAPEMRERLDAIIDAQNDPEQLMALARRFGSRVSARESVPTALAVFLAHRNDPLEAMTAAISLGRDTDTVAAMAGALAGAHHGARQLPGHLLARLEDHDRIDTLARQLAALPRPDPTPTEAPG